MNKSYHGGVDDSSSNLSVYDSTSNLSLSEMPLELLSKINDELDTTSTEQWAQTSRSFRNLLIDEKFYARNKSDRYLQTLIEDPKYTNDEYFLDKLEKELEKSGRIWSDEEINEIYPGVKLTLTEKLNPNTAITFDVPLLPTHNRDFVNRDFVVSENRKWFILGNKVLFNGFVSGKGTEIIRTGLRYMNVYENVIWYLYGFGVYKIDLQTGKDELMGNLPNIEGNLFQGSLLLGDKTSCTLLYQTHLNCQYFQGKYVKNEFVFTTMECFVDETKILMKELWKSQTLFDLITITPRAPKGYTIINNEIQYDYIYQNSSKFAKLTNIKNEVCYFLSSELTNCYLVFFDYVKKTEKRRLLIFTDEYIQLPFLKTILSNDRTKILVHFVRDIQTSYFCTVDSINKKVLFAPFSLFGGDSFNRYTQMFITNSGNVVVVVEFLDDLRVNINSFFRGNYYLNYLFPPESSFSVIEEDLYVYHRTLQKIDVFHIS
jgi:hypothetical protein